ncbi:MAG: sigma 54-interacting transcriptional regulator [Polyangia bacterium]
MLRNLLTHSNESQAEVPTAAGDRARDGRSDLPISAQAAFSRTGARPGDPREGDGAGPRPPGLGPPELAQRASGYSVRPSPPALEAADAQGGYGADPRTPVLPLLSDRPRHRAAASGLLLRADSGEARSVTRPIRIGSARDNDWVLADPYVSHHHAVLQPHGDGLRVVDRGSRNGTFLNGACVQSGELRLGGVLQLGRTQLRLCSTGQDSLLIGDSPAMAAVRQRIERFAPTLLPVLIAGESGTGKELVARSLHEQSGRPGALIVVNCGALPRELIESELFGHERGAFTGAQRRHLGCFGEADGGTLFLDEIGELPLDLQPRLLRALESRAIRPVGAAREVAVDVRLVAATHRDLLRLVAAGHFRADLYYRIAGLEIAVPPLRARPADVPLLVRHFLAAPPAPPGCTIDDEELDRVARHPWPGNVRQLRHAVLRAVHLGGPRLCAADLLDEPLHAAASARSSPGGADTVPVLGRRFIDIERDIYVHALSQTGGNRRAAAELLEIPKSTLHDRLRRLGIRLQRDATPCLDGEEPADGSAPAGL